MILLAVVALGLSSCARPQAERALSSTAQLLADIEQNYRGLEYEPDRIESVRQLMSEANQVLATDPGQARTLARQARAEAEQILEAVRPRHADVIYNEAIEEIAVADVNELQRRDAERYQRIREVRSEAEEARAENRYDQVIQLSNEIIREVQTGLSPLQNAANRARIDAEQAINELRAEGGPVYAPQVVASVEAEFEAALDIVERDRDYVLAANRFNEARLRAEEGVVLVLREQSRERIEEIERLLTEALLEQVEIYRPQEYERAASVLESMNVDYEDGRYRDVLHAADTLRPQAQALVIDTKRDASDDRIRSMRSNIRDLEEGGIEEYLPAALDRMRNFLAQAEELRPEDTEDAFDEIKDISIEAEDEYERQRGRFRDLAQDEIRSARTAVDSARAVFDRMEAIFEPISFEHMSPEERAFEAQKDSRRIRLGQELEEASNNLVSADLQLQDDNFRRAIILAEQAQETAQVVLNEVYHVVAHNTSIELARLITRYEREGARIYAPDDLVRSRENLEEVKASIAAGQYLRAVQQAAEARADVELMAQAIAGRASEDIREAREVLREVTSERTRRYTSAQLGEVRQLIEEAEEDLRQDRLRIAVEKAERAMELARAAEEEANRQVAQNQIEGATGMITRAQDARAELYAGRELEDARRLLSTAQTLFATGDYLKAEELGAISERRANDALFRKINTADAEIASARAVGAWDRDSARFARANTMVREARALLEEGHYDESARRADRAASIASSLAVQSRRANFRDRIRDVNRNLDKGTDQGINFFQREESEEIRREVNTLLAEYSDDQYERIMDRVERLEARLRFTLDQTDERVMELAEHLEGRIESLREARARDFAEQELNSASTKIHHARIDFRRGNFRSAHRNLHQAFALVDEAEFRKGAEGYRADVVQLFDEYLEAQNRFRNVLGMDAPMLRQAVTGPDGSRQGIAISARYTPNDYRAKLDELYTRAAGLEHPERLADVHDAVIQTFAEGRLAAIHFEKLVILDMVSKNEADNLISQAYARQNRSNRLMGAVQEQLFADKVRFRLVQAGSSILVD